MDRNEINAKFRELAQYKMMIEEATELKEAVEAELKAIMETENIDTLIGDEHKVTWKEVTSNRFDSKAFKANHADLYNAFTKPSTSRRFTFS